MQAQLLTELQHYKIKGDDHLSAGTGKTTYMSFYQLFK